MQGLFGDMFDFNNDGNLDCCEQAAEFMFTEVVMKDINKSNDNDDDEEDD